jgi:hypothetical protein
VEAVETQKELEAVHSFQALSGVGSVATCSCKWPMLISFYRLVKAREFVRNKGWKTLEDVMQDDAFNSLPKRTQTALRFSSRTLEQIPREDVAKVVESIAKTLKDFEVHATGSLCGSLFLMILRLIALSIVEEGLLSRPRLTYCSFIQNSKQHFLQGDRRYLNGYENLQMSILYYLMP